MMNVTAIVPRCCRDNEILVIQELGLSEHHQLVILGYCSKCLKNAKVIIPLAELIEHCPESSDYYETDINRMHGLSILPDYQRLLPPPDK